MPSLFMHEPAPKHTSPWFDSVPDERRFPVLREQKRVEVVVVGGGLTGVLAAWLLAKQGVSVALLEKHHLGSGDSGFTTAFLTRVPDVDLAALRRQSGEMGVRHLFAASRGAQEFLRQLIQTEQIECAYVSCPSWFGAYAAADAALHDEWQVIESADPKSQWVTGADTAAPFVEAVRFDDEGRFNIRQFLFGLLARPAARSISVFEESAVVDVRIGDDVTLTTAAGEVRARRVIVATGKPLDAFRELHGLLRPVVTYALAARYDQGAPIADALFWDTDEPYQYLRRLDEQTVIVGGEDRGVGQRLPDGSLPPHDALRTYLRERFSAQHAVTHAWSGSLYFTDTGVPYAAEHPQYRDRVFVATGFGGNGLVFGALAAQTVVALATGSRPAHAPLFSFTRLGTIIPVLAPRPHAAASVPRSVPRSRPWLRWAFPALFVILAMIPGWIFFQSRGGLTFFRGSDLQQASGQLFPLFGLYAFFLVWVQVVLGANMPFWRRSVPGLDRFHRVEGPFALLFALLHPFLLILAIGLTRYVAKDFVAPNLKPYILLGQIQLALLVTTAGTALLRRQRWFARVWRRLHYLNYVVFSLVWVHSWFLGSDVQSTPLRWFWLLTLASVVVSVGLRLRRAWSKRAVPSTADQEALRL